MFLALNFNWDRCGTHAEAAPPRERASSGFLRARQSFRANFLWCSHFAGEQHKPRLVVHSGAERKG